MMTNELYHHGRLHQRWGVRNGPPYPLSSATVKKAYTKKKRGIAGVIEAHRQKKVEEKAAKAAKEEAARKAAAEKEKARKEADKERVLREGSAIEVSQYANELTNKELQDVVNRIKNRNELAKYTQQELDQGWKTVDSVMKKVGNIKDWTKTGVELWEQLDKAMKLLDSEKKK